MAKQVIYLLSIRAKNFNHNEDNTSGAFITAVLLETSVIYLLYFTSFQLFFSWALCLSKWSCF